MSDIVEKLKGPRTEQGGLWPHPNLHDEAADEILRLRAENAKLRAALKDCAGDLEAEINHRYGNVHPALQNRYDRDMSTVRAAAAALKETGDDGI